MYIPCPAIGGCGIKQIDLVNAYSTIARQGMYKPQSTILEVKNNSGEIIKKWTDTAGKKVIDAQSAYIVSDILSDDYARAPLDGLHALGMEIPGVRTATKTGTSDKGGNAKDIWMFSYSPALTMGVWLGNSDASILTRGTSSIPGAIIAKVIEYAHKDVYTADKLWKSGDWYIQPTGIQVIGRELFPSWWNKNQGKTNAKLTFDRVSKKKATDLTPEGARIEIDVTKMIDPVTKKDVFIAPDGYDASKDDDVHKSSDVKPTVSINWIPTSTPNVYTVTATVSRGTFSITNVQILINGAIVKELTGSGSFTYTVKESDKAKTTSSKVIDSGYYTGTGTGINIPA